jgi:hypothetical protein
MERKIIVFFPLITWHSVPLLEERCTETHLLNVMHRLIILVTKILYSIAIKILQFIKIAIFTVYLRSYYCTYDLEQAIHLSLFPSL